MLLDRTGDVAAGEHSEVGNGNGSFKTFLKLIATYMLQAIAIRLSHFGHFRCCQDTRWAVLRATMGVRVSEMVHRITLIVTLNFSYNRPKMEES